MLRRRSKTPKHAPRDGRGQSPYTRRSRGARPAEPRKESVAPAPGSRRRGRPDAPVPAELVIKETLSPALSQGRGRTAASQGRGSEAVPLSQGRGSKAVSSSLGRGSGGGSGVVLVTGFECFGGETTNPSWEVCERLPAMIAGLRVEKVRVPCEFRRSIEVAAEAIERHRPVLVVCLGQAGGRSQIGVERVAVNIDDARIADNSGEWPIDEPIAADGPPAYFATLPVKAMVEAMRKSGVPADLSNSAGTYVCNHVMYGVLHFLAARRIEARAGFIHVPYAEEQVLDKAGVAAMSLDTMARGVEAAIMAAVRHRADLKRVGGTTS